MTDSEGWFGSAVGAEKARQIVERLTADDLAGALHVLNNLDVAESRRAAWALAHMHVGYSRQRGWDAEKINAETERWVDHATRKYMGEPDEDDHRR